MESKLARKRKLDEFRQETGQHGQNASAASSSSAAIELKAPSQSTVPYRNKQRCLVFCSRGITPRYRHFMGDLRRLMPHHKTDVKFDAKGTLQQINEIAEMKSCNTCVYLEARKKRDLYMWVGNTPNGPSAKFHVLNVHTMDELKLTGNSLVGSRPLLTFDAAFDAEPHLQLLKRIFVQVFGTPRGHPKSKPFVDRVMGFYWLDNKIWVRNYQIADNRTAARHDAAAVHAGRDPTELIEMGPRFVLNCARIFDGSFGGQTLYQNPAYQSPSAVRSSYKAAKAERYNHNVMQAKRAQQRRADATLPPDQLGQFSDVFKGEDEADENDEEDKLDNVPDAAADNDSGDANSDSHSD